MYSITSDSTSRGHVKIVKYNQTEEANRKRNKYMALKLFIAPPLCLFCGTVSTSPLEKASVVTFGCIRKHCIVHTPPI